MRTVLFSLGLLAALAGGPARAADFFFKDGDSVVMIGDSITEQHLYSNYVEMWTVTRFPAWKITFRNVGIGGDRSVGGNSRFKRDVLPHRPTAMTVDFGMNDAGYRLFDQGLFKQYMDGLQGMANQARASKIRTAWITPQPLDGPDQGPTALTGYNVTLEKFSEGVKEIAEKNEGLFVDQFHPYLKVLDQARAKDQKYDRITAGDAVHPGPPGQALMAASILEGLGFPRLVSAATVDTGTKSATDLKNCKITEIVVADGGVTFLRHDTALPFFPPEAAPILKHSPLLERLNEYQLQVKGLTQGMYEVRLGGTKVAEYSAEELATGVNLAKAALAAGPVAEQVKAVKAAIEKKNTFHHNAIFRGVILMPVAIPDWLELKLTAQDVEAKRQATYADRMSKMPELDAEVARALEIKAHKVEITPVKK